MKKLFFCLFVVFSVPALGRMGGEQAQWLKGNFEIPAVIDAITDVNELEPFLTATDEFSEHLAKQGHRPAPPEGFRYSSPYQAVFLRMAAVRKLGQLEGEKSIERLLEIFHDQPLASWPYFAHLPYVRHEVIRTFGRIGGEKAKDALMDLFNAYWANVDDILHSLEETPRRANAPASEFVGLVHEMLRELKRWSGDDDVYDLAQRLIQDLRGPAGELFGNLFITNATKLYVKSEFIQTKFKGQEAVAHLLAYYEGMPSYVPTGLDRADDLLSGERLTFYTMFSDDRIEAHKVWAALRLLYEFEDSVLLAFRDDILRQIRQQQTLLDWLQGDLKFRISLYEGYQRRTGINDERSLERYAAEISRLTNDLHIVEKLTAMQDLQGKDYRTLINIRVVDQQRDEYNELRNQWRTDIIPLLHRAYIMDKVLREKVDNAK